MPSYLDFDSTKKLRDAMLAKTLVQPNGPQTFTSGNYSIQNTSNFSNVDPGEVSDQRPKLLSDAANSNTFKPEIYVVKENLDILPRRANLGLYPYFQRDQDHSLISILTTDKYDDESELFKFAASNIKNSPEGPIQARIRQNLLANTLNKVRVLDALGGNTNTAIGLISGREPLVEKNYKITVAKSLAGKVVDFAQTVAGVEFPWSEIPGDYLSNPANPVKYRPEAKTGLGKAFQDITGVLGSLIGIERRPKRSRKPSDLLIEYMGNGQLQTLYNNLSFSKYKPNYTTSARSQQSSKLFNFPNQIAQGIKSIIGVEAPSGNAYIGDDRGEDVMYAMSDFNDRPVRSSYYLSLMFDETATRLFHVDKNISEGGQIGGKLTWVSRQSNAKIKGVHNAEWESEASKHTESLSTAYDFRNDSILGETQRLLDTLPENGGEAKGHVANVIDQTSRVFREGETMLSRGSAVKYIDKFSGEESGVEYCRVWTKDRSYMNYSDTMKRTGLIRKFNDSVMTTPWNLNIAPMSNGQRTKEAFNGSTNIINGQAKKYMFSIENLAWKTSNKAGFTYNDLPYCERGPNGGRVMWFPPYDLKFSEQNTANWETTKFIGRPEPIYTYQNAERSGTISFKVIVDHPSVLNLLVKKRFEGMSDEESTNYINSFFAGCEQLDFYDLIRRYGNLESEEIEIIQLWLSYYRDGKTSDDYLKLKFRKTAGKIVSTNPNNSDGLLPYKSEPLDTGGTTGQPISFDGDLYFRNDQPYPQDGLYADSDYEAQYNSYVGMKSTYQSKLASGLASIFASDSANNKKDRKTLYNTENPDPSVTGKTVTELNDGFTKLDTSYNKLKDATASIKKDIESKKIKEVKLEMQSSTSFVADEKYNIKLAFRRSDSVAKYVLKAISKNGTAPSFKWKTTPAELKSNPAQRTEEITISFKDLGYGDDTQGNVIIKFVMLGENTANSDCGGVDCHNIELLNTSGLKIAAPITFLCRHTKVNLNYTTVDETVGSEGFDDYDSEPLQEYGSERVYPPKVEIDVETKTVNRKPPLDALKLIIMKILSECFYFQQLEESSPLAYSALRDKLKYFHPAFHSMTPEGLNSRLTFIHQCLRPGDTIPIKDVGDEMNLDARNTTFGPPPICVLRIGDFYHSKIVIGNVQINYDDAPLDMNPEGIGIQPMIANVTMQVNFIGGQGLKEPIAKLQNALSFNFYGNTEVYDHRSTATEDRTKFNISELEKILAETPRTPKTPTVVGSQNKPIDGTYIGTSDDATTLNYLSFVSETGDNSIFENTKKYFDNFKTKYNELLVSHGPLLMPMFISPDYRKKYKMDVNDSVSTTTEIELLGVYDSKTDYSILVNNLSKALISKLNSISSVSTFFEFDSFLQDYKIVRSDLILKPFILDIIKRKIIELEGIKLNEIEAGRNKIVQLFDKLNFVLSTGGFDGKTDKEVVTGKQLANFVPVDFYDRYKKVVTFIQKEHTESFTNDLDATINFSTVMATTMSDSLFNTLIGYFISENDITAMEKLYENSEDKTFFTSNVISKMSKKLKKLITTTKEKKIKFKHPNVKDTNPLSYTTSDATLSDNDKEKLKKVLNSKDNSAGVKLNYLR